MLDFTRKNERNFVRVRQIIITLPLSLYLLLSQLKHSKVLSTTAQKSISLFFCRVKSQLQKREKLKQKVCFSSGLGDPLVLAYEISLCTLTDYNRTSYLLVGPLLSPYQVSLLTILNQQTEKQQQQQHWSLPRTKVRPSWAIVVLGALSLDVDFRSSRMLLIVCALKE